jgi:biopolymer transport protein TolQ
MSAELPGAAGGVDILSLMLHASVVVQLVLLTLVAASVFSWAIILQKKKAFAAAAAEAEAFGGKFWNGGDLGSLYRAAEPRRRELVGLEAVFEAGEFSRLRTAGGLDAGELMDGARRAMRVVQTREVERLEEGLATLATIGSTSPYVGLFGTVWGILNAFIGLGQVKQATLAMVAPGIAEALVATAIGLLAAIPAVIAYNRYSDRLTRLEVKLDTFAEELSTILQRHAARAS